AVAARDVFWVQRAEGGSMVIPREEELRMLLRFPGQALAEPVFTLEGTVSAPLESLSVAGQSLRPDTKGHVAVKLRLPEVGAGIAIEARFADGFVARFEHQLSARGNFFLLVGLAEGKLGYVQRDGSAGNSGLYAEGRVKLYTKGRIQGRWLIEG